MSIRLYIILITAAALVLGALVSNALAQSDGLSNTKPGQVVPVNMVCRHSATVAAFLKGDKTEAQSIVRWAARSGECHIIMAQHVSQLFPAILKEKISEGRGLDSEGRGAVYQVWSIETKPETKEDYFIGLISTLPEGEKI